MAPTWRANPPDVRQVLYGYSARQEDTRSRLAGRGSPCDHVPEFLIELTHERRCMCGALTVSEEEMQNCVTYLRFVQMLAEKIHALHPNGCDPRVRFGGVTHVPGQGLRHVHGPGDTTVDVSDAMAKDGSAERKTSPFTNDRYIDLDEE